MYKEVSEGGDEICTLLPSQRQRLYPSEEVPHPTDRHIGSQDTIREFLRGTTLTTMCKIGM